MWKSWLLLVVLLTSPFTVVFGQADSRNYIEFNELTDLVGVLNTESLLENPQTAVNAFYLKVRCERKNCMVYASIPSGITTSASTPMPVGTLMLKLRSTTCPAAQQVQVVNTDIPMNTSNSLLFQQDNKANVIANWYYDVKIPAIGYTYAPGNYNFTFRFTMTQP